MFFKIMRTKNGFTLVEILIVVSILAILTAIAVPMYSFDLKKNKIADCKSQATAIQATVKLAMGGMYDNGASQDKIRFESPNIKEASHYTTYTADSITDNADDGYNEDKCFVLIYETEATSELEAFTLGDLRGGYRCKDHDNVENHEANPYSDYESGFVNGHYLKKRKYSSVDKERDVGGETYPIKYFYTFLANQEIPVCPFADFENSDTTDDYRYYIFEDGTVICSCPDCH